MAAAEVQGRSTSPHNNSYSIIAFPSPLTLVIPPSSQGTSLRTIPTVTASTVTEHAEANNDTNADTNNENENENENEKRIQYISFNIAIKL